MRPRLADDPQFEAVSEEAERLRFFKDYVKALKVSKFMSKPKLALTVKYMYAQITENY